MFFSQILGLGRNLAYLEFSLSVDENLLSYFRVLVSNNSTASRPPDQDPVVETICGGRTGIQRLPVSLLALLYYRDDSHSMWMVCSVHLVSHHRRHNL